MLLEVKSLRTRFFTEAGVVRAVDGVSFSMESGKTLALVGESGCGKSVSALSLMRLLPQPPAKIEAERLRFLDKDLLSLSKEEMRFLSGNEIAMIFQDPMTSLNPVYTVGYQVAEVLWIHHKELSLNEVKSRVIELFRMVGISDAPRRWDQYPHEFSGGMRQRVMIAMALICNPKLLIADEPTTALDVTIQAQILELIRSLQQERKMALLLITHDLGVVAEMADEVVVMYAGKVAERASVETLYAHPLHPYTVGLLESIPSRQVLTSHEGGRGRLKAIAGTVPSPLDLPVGCRFQDRCPLVQPHCRESEPPLEEKEKDHWASCFEV